MERRSEALARARQRYTELFSLSPSAYLMTDARGVVREANRAAADLLGRSMAFLAGKPLAALLCLESRPELRRRLLLGGAAHWRAKLVCGREITLAARAVLTGEQRIAGYCWLLRPGSG